MYSQEPFWPHLQQQQQLQHQQEEQQVRRGERRWGRRGSWRRAGGGSPGQFGMFWMLEVNLGCFGKFWQLGLGCWQKHQTALLNFGYLRHLGFLLKVLFGLKILPPLIVHIMLRCVSDFKFLPEVSSSAAATSATIDGGLNWDVERAQPFIYHQPPSSLLIHAYAMHSMHFLCIGNFNLSNLLLCPSYGDMLSLDYKTCP